MKPIAIVLAVAAGAILASAAPADAASCNYVAAAKAVVITLSNASDAATLRRGPNGEISAGASPCPARATGNNTNVIFIRDNTPNKDGDDFVGIDLSGGPLGPGATIKGSVETSEIPVDLYLEGGKNFVYLTGSDGPDDIRLGRHLAANSEYMNAIDLNAGSETDANADADVFFQPAYPSTTRRTRPSTSTAAPATTPSTSPAARASTAR